MLQLEEEVLGGGGLVTEGGGGEGRVIYHSSHGRGENQRLFP